MHSNLHDLNAFNPAFNLKMKHFKAENATRKIDSLPLKIALILKSLQKFQIFIALKLINLFKFLLLIKRNIQCPKFLLSYFFYENIYRIRSTYYFNNSLIKNFSITLKILLFSVIIELIFINF